MLKFEAGARQFQALGNLKQTYWTDFHPKSLNVAVQTAAQMKWSDTDLTGDYHCILDTEEVEAMILETGGFCVKHECGFDMIRQAPKSLA